MRLDRALFLFALPVLLIACSETPRCVERGTPPRTSIVIECNAGKVPVCGNDPADLYDDHGALRPVPAASVADGLCPAGATNCRTRPVCQQETMSAVCNDGLGVTCVLGAIDEIAPPRPDSGPAPQDAGSDAGTLEEDAGSEDDAGSADAGEDAG
jgi:hypothetical protein